MAVPSRQEYKMAFHLLRNCAHEIADSETLLCCCCIISYLKCEGPWTEFQTRQLAETWVHVTG